MKKTRSDLLLRSWLWQQGAGRLEHRKTGGRKTYWAVIAVLKGRRWASEESRGGRGGKKRCERQFQRWNRLHLVAGCRCLTLKISWMIKTTTKKECKEWKRFVGEENESSFRHTTLEAPLPVKMLCCATLEMQIRDCREIQPETRSAPTQGWSHGNGWGYGLANRKRRWGSASAHRVRENQRQDPEEPRI